MKKSSKQYTLLLFLSLCLLGIGIVFCLTYFKQYQDKKQIAYATCYDDLMLSVKHNGETESVKIWHDDMGQYYFFLPSYVTEESSLTLGNLKETDYITLCNTPFYSTDNINKQFTYSISYDVTLCIAGSKAQSVPLMFYKSENLPTVFLNTETGSIDAIHSDKTIQEKGALTIKSVDGTTQYSHDIEYIRARGASSFRDTDKKSYQFKLYQEDSILDMPAAKKWLLIANFIDDSLIRNKFVYQYAKDYTSLHAPNGEFIDLYINNEYRGNYLLCEKIEVSENRLELHNLDDDNNALNSDLSLQEPILSPDGTIKAFLDAKSPKDITGGYLVVLNSLENAHTGFVTKHGYSYEIVSPENATFEEACYIQSLFNEMEDAIYSSNGINPNSGKHFSQYIDISSFAEKYLIEEVFHNPDSGFASVYFYKDSDSIDPHIYAGPVWDYDRALGSYGANKQYLDSAKGINNYLIYASQLMSHKIFNDYVFEAFNTTMLPYITTQAEHDINISAQQLLTSAQLNKLRWTDVKGYYDCFSSNIEYLYSFLKERSTYLESVWFYDEQYHTITFLDYDGNIHEQYTVKHGDKLNCSPVLNSYVALFDGWKNTKTGKTYIIDLPILEDATYQSQWIDVSLILENGLAISEKDVNSLNTETLKLLIKSIENKQSSSQADEE